MELLYKLFVGPVNPKKPAESFFLQLWLLKRLGLWAPETENKLIRTLYTLWSYFYRGFFLWIYTLTQIMFFKDVEDMTDVAEGFFLLLTQIALIYKVEMFYRNRHRIRACEKLLRSTLFRPKDDEEDAVIKESMILTFVFGMAFLVPALITIASWAIMPFLEEELHLPIVAWYPFSIENPIVFGMTYFYQIYGIVMSASFNVSTDTFASSMISHANGQVQRLGIQLKKIGYDNGESIKKDLKILKNQSAIIMHDDERMIEINKQISALKRKHGENYGEVIRCIIYHEEILKFCAEIKDIFKGPIFAQMVASTVIICMTCFLLVQQIDNIGAASSSVSYLLTMVTQILLFCWIGNEVIYSSYRLTEQAYFSNFQSFDRNTAKALLIFMQRSSKDIYLSAGAIFEVHLSLPIFMGIMKSSYSYFAVLNSMQNK
ncbi:odorant receptor Or1-like isoform X1 [Chironomus tepperi]|uniref:odorant receptor Or1-like isoform X1 n=2 Tax=Chironomus tepperi TaxID=113505 RepID=UPI00391EEAF1